MTESTEIAHGITEIEGQHAVEQARLDVERDNAACVRRAVKARLEMLEDIKLDIEHSEQKKRVIEEEIALVEEADPETIKKMVRDGRNIKQMR